MLFSRATLAGALALGACERAPSPEAPAARVDAGVPAATVAAPPAAPTLPTASLEVPALGVTLDAPVGARVLGAPGGSVRVEGHGGACAVTLTARSDRTYLPSRAQALETIEKGVLGAHRRTLTRRLGGDADWTLHYERADPLDETRSVWVVDVRRSAGAAEVACARAAADAADVACALRVCESLRVRPLKGAPSSGAPAKGDADNEP